ncbi:beta-N-acetylhexosaminidase [Paenibacillus aurantius]|uniref:Beta-N-acetylhexosaminidase n=1 Tax=Paenibacillus aurantius TaxID=2918900 RepID=A0AA96LGL6_9BACL|nr:beta-N-acetylhexosaminidase [Paenibacillus aurantius]WNQ12859.1 beta-N-acetylhexosaminidase [Paenibacillus aurantius]
MTKLNPTNHTYKRNAARAWRRAAGCVLLAGLLAAGGCGPKGGGQGAGAASASPPPVSSPGTTASVTSTPSAASTPPAGPTPTAAAVSPTPPPDAIREKLRAMTREEKVGQLVLVGMDGRETNAQTKELIRTYKVGGFIFFKVNLTGTDQALRLFTSLKDTNRASSSIPLWMSVDEEGGRVTRLPDEFEKFPSMGSLGKKNSSDLTRQVGKLIGRELAGFGLNTDFAPVLDVNSNPDNPVIGDRSFGSSAERVSRLGVAEMKGLQSEGILSVVKHFPGHGDTSVDSHIGLPVVPYDMDRLKKLELVPFAEAVKNGADAVMVAHLLLPKLDSKHPASFSKAVITDVLRKQLGFGGVVFTDDMTMGAVVKNYSIGQAAVQAILAGGDIVLVGHDFEKQTTVIQALRKAAADGTLSEERLDESVYRILKLKAKYGVTDARPSGPDVKAINADIRKLLAP